jgi:sugar phosphate isomerase/epimerase
VLQVRVSIQLASLRQPFKQALLTAARMGAQAVEIDARGEIRPHELSRTGVRHVLKMLDDLNLRASSVTFHTQRGYDVLDNLEARIEGTKQAMQFAWDMGASVVVNQVGSIPEDESSVGWQTMTQALADIGRHGQRVGATLCATTGADPAAHLLKLLDALPVGSLGVAFDPAALIMAGQNPTEAMRLLTKHTLHLYARDAVRLGGAAGGKEVPLGRGSVEIPDLLALLEQHGFAGWITVARAMGDDSLSSELQQAISFLKNI